MPTYFFDVDDGEFSLRDEFGVELETLSEAAEQAAALLPDIARDTLLGLTSRDVSVSVRDEAGRVVHRASLLFRAEWMPEAGHPAPARGGRRTGAGETGRLSEGRPVPLGPGSGRAEDEPGRLSRGWAPAGL